MQNMNPLERRYIALDIQLIEPEESRADKEQPKITGHAAVFDVLSEDFGGWREKIAPGAFSKSVGGDVRALFNHDPNIILGRTLSKTLRLKEDNRGLYTEIDPPNTSTARHVIEAIRRGDVTQMSFGFRTLKDEWKFDNTKDEAVRTLIDVELFDISPVTFPAYPTTDVAVREFRDFMESLKKSEPWRLNLALREMQFIE
jgi:hypothetical protein